MPRFRLFVAALALVGLVTLGSWPAAAGGAPTPAPAALNGDSQGSYVFFTSTPTPVQVNWYYHSSSQTVTVSASLKGSSIGSGTLSASSTSLQLSGSSGGDAAVVNLSVDLSDQKLATQAAVSGVNGNRNGTHTSDF